MLALRCVMMDKEDIVIQECGLRHFCCFWFCCLKSSMKSTSVLTSSSFTALYIDTLIPPTDLKTKHSAVLSVADMQSVTVSHNSFSVKYFGQSGHGCSPFNLYRNHLVWVWQWDCHDYMKHISQVTHKYFRKLKFVLSTLNTLKLTNDENQGKSWLRATANSQSQHSDMKKQLQSTVQSEYEPSRRLGHSVSVAWSNLKYFLNLDCSILKRNTQHNDTMRPGLLLQSHPSTLSILKLTLYN